MRILVIEDDAGIAAGLRTTLQQRGYAVDVCGDVASAWSALRTERFDAVLLDLGLPDADGSVLLQRLRSAPATVGASGAALPNPATPVLIVTARDQVQQRIAGLDMGADDYVAKPFSPRELVARVRTILRRSGRAAATDSDKKTPPATTAQAQEAIDSGVKKSVRHGPLLLDEERRLIRYHGQALELSRYEYGLLAALMQRPGRVYTRDELLERVWDDPGESFDRTVDAHIKTLRAKLRAVRNDEDPIRTLRGVGYALREEH